MSELISIILNSRKRPTLLKNLLDSIENTVSSLDNIKVYISFDDDDIESYDFISEYTKNKKWIWYEFIERDCSLHRRLNRLAKISVGNYIWVLNDDCKIEGIKNWDIIIYGILSNIYQDNIVSGLVHDDSCDKQRHLAEYASFPIVSRKAHDILNYFMREDFVGLGADYALYKLYNSINRIVDVPLYVSHVLHQTFEQIQNPDETCREMRENTYKNMVTINLSQDIKKLQDYIENFEKIS